MIPKAVLPIRYKYDIDLLRWQCYHCNINLGGNGAKFIKKWEKETKKNGQLLINKINREPLLGGIDAELYLKDLYAKLKNTLVK